MKTMIKGTIKDERGKVLTLVLILLLVGGLMLAPLLGLMSTGLLAGQVYEEKMGSYYAADAGVEDAIWKIKYDPPGSYPYQYPEPLIVDGMTVDVVIYRYDWDETCGEDLTYRILSTVITDDGGGTAGMVNSTTIDTHLSVSYLDLSALLDNAIVSDDTITLKGDTVVNGDIWLPDEEDLLVDDHVTINGTVKDEDDVSIVWPTAEQFSTYYMENVEGAYDPGGFIDIKDLYPKTLGPWYREGSLGVDNTGDPDTLVLEDTIYVTGNLEFIQPGASRNYTINLNGQTIFVEGDFSLASTSISIFGSGCIIAVGDINFQPNIVGDEDDFVLVMSVTGETFFHPSGDFTGCIVGDTHVQLQPGCTITWISPEGKGLNVPLGVGDDDRLPPVTGLRIESWVIS